ncbi:WD40-repeat-containing domain protein [Suillus cothurnatus]|nr:WD40-repeat-containing domain protein [Suillus cothurnatus]
MSFLANFFNKPAQPERYKLVASLNAYSGSVHALAISNDGHILAGGGTEGIKFWDVQSRKELTCSPHECRGTVSCAVWATTRQTAAETLCYGTGLGYIVFVRRSLIDKTFQEICARRLGSGFEITCLSWHSSADGNIRIAVGTRDKMVQVLVLNANLQLQSVFAVQLETTIPKSVAFTDSRDIYVFGLYDGNFMKLNEEGNVIKEINCQSVITHQKRGVFVVDNAIDGFTLYRLEGEGESVRTFTTAVPSMSVPKQVVFGEEGKVVIGGSDNGLVYVFDRKTGQIIQTLRHADVGLVQTITGRDLDGRCTIASASPGPGRRKTTIKMWAYDYAAQKVPESPLKNHWSLSSILMILTQLLALLVMSVFLLVNYKDRFFDTAVNHLQYVTSATAADDFSRHVKAAMMFEDYSGIKTEGRTKGHAAGDIRLLQELADKLMELARAGGEIDEDEHQEDYDNEGTKVNYLVAPEQQG